MDELDTQESRKSTSAGTGDHGAPAQAGVIGIGLAAVLTFALAQGSWEWFAAYIGVTLLAVIFSAYRLPPWTPGLRSAYTQNLVAYSLVVGLCVAIALAPMLQRSAWLLPMPRTRSDCRNMGKYESLQAEAALANLASRDGAALAYAQDRQSHEATADCLASTTTRWLPMYGLGAAVLAGLGTWSFGRTRVLREADLATRTPRRRS
ncbi:hypothetical protein OG905_37950 [Streptomyces sp. NBC_00322]|uniref:hypothetical protein n=1 Tax=Streptomyces sp. NBC_00322 TaxID=2975712 RepID=UPI002E27FF3E|nr:hypothetical protein [Streptomyces sp. NBC_00322]